MIVGVSLSDFDLRGSEDVGFFSLCICVLRCECDRDGRTLTRLLFSSVYGGGAPMCTGCWY